MSKTNLFEEFDKISSPTSENKPEVKQPETPETKTEVKAEEKVEPEKKEEPKKEKKVIKSVFGEHVIDGEEAEVIDTPEKFFDKLKKETGAEVKAFEDVFKILNDPNKVPKQKLEDAELRVKEYDVFFSTMPDDLKALVADYYNKADYKQTMSKMVGKVDYSKPVTTYKEEDLIVMYNPEISKDDFEDMSEREKNSLYKAAKTLYEKEHNEIIGKAEKTKQMQFDSAKKYVESIEASVEELKKQMPNLGADKTEKIRQQMLQGYSLYENNANNAYRKDAAYRIAMAEHGKDIVQSIIDEAAKITQRKIEQVKTETNEEMLKTKTNDKIKTTSKELPPPDAVEEIRRNEMPFLQQPKIKK